MADERWDHDIIVPVDILQRLRWPFPHVGLVSYEAFMLMREAADEIARLRAQWLEAELALEPPREFS